MKSSKGLIVASYNEGFGRMTAEANMLGIPVIGRDTAGTKEILDQTYGGVKFESLNSFVEGLNRLADMHEEEVQEMMAEPQKISINLFSEEQHLKKILEIYGDVMKYYINVKWGGVVYPNNIYPFLPFQKDVAA